MRAILHSVYERVLHDERGAIVAWLLGVASTAALMLAFYPTVRDRPDLDALVKSYPEAFKAMFGFRDLASPESYLHTELFSLILPLLVLVYAVLAGADATAGEEERRTIDLLLANPVSRAQVVLEKFAALVTVVALMGVTTFAVVAGGGPLVQLHLGVARLAGACAGLVLLGAGFGALALALGAATGKRGLARGVTAAVAVVAYLVASLATLVQGLKPGVRCPPTTTRWCRSHSGTGSARITPRSSWGAFSPCWRWRRGRSIAGTWRCSERRPADRQSRPGWPAGSLPPLDPASARA